MAARLSQCCCSPGRARCRPRRPACSSVAKWRYWPSQQPVDSRHRQKHCFQAGFLQATRSEKMSSCWESISGTSRTNASGNIVDAMPSHARRLPLSCRQINRVDGPDSNIQHGGENSRRIFPGPSPPSGSASGGRPWRRSVAETPQPSTSRTLMRPWVRCAEGPGPRGNRGVLTRCRGNSPDSRKVLPGKSRPAAGRRGREWVEQTGQAAGDAGVDFEQPLVFDHGDELAEAPLIWVRKRLKAMLWSRSQRKVARFHVGDPRIPGAYLCSGGTSSLERRARQNQPAGGMPASEVVLPVLQWLAILSSPVDDAHPVIDRFALHADVAAGERCSMVPESARQFCLRSGLGAHCHYAAVLRRSVIFSPIVWQNDNYKAAQLVKPVTR